MIGRRPAKVHYLAENAGERTPHRFLVLDTESRWRAEAGRELHQLRNWAAVLVRRHNHAPRLGRRATAAGSDLAGLMAQVETWSRGEDALWLFTHNLSFDLGLTRLPLRLLDAGWELGAHNLASDAPWAIYRRKGHTLRLADSLSWFGVSVEDLGRAIGRGKPELPDPGAPAEDWAARCRADAEIVAEALEAAMDEWDARGLGVWSLTGPASGWNALRHAMGKRPGARRTTVTVTAPGQSRRAHRTDFVIDPDPDARAFERLALYSGRRDLWRCGPLGGGPWVELDLRAAHLSVLATCPLPYRRWAPFPRLELEDWRLANPGASVLARCRVRTASPRYPLRWKGAILHPVGEFWTVLCGPELADARDRGDLLEVGPGYGYHLGDQLQPWARWALDVIAPDAVGVPGVLRLMVKSWSRSVPGRWAMTVARPAAAGPSHVADWALEPGAYGNPPRRAFLLHLAGQWTTYVRDQEGDDAFPAVLAHIQAWTRLALNRALEPFGPEDLASCNTEGFWVHQAALDALGHGSRAAAGRSRSPEELTAAALAQLNARTAPLDLRVKRTARRLEVKSPQHLQVDGRREYAGVPRSATELEPGRFEFLTWPKLKGQIERGDPRGYVRELRTVNLTGLPVSRWTYQDGCCEPVEARVGSEPGAVCLLPPWPSCGPHGARLRDCQHPALRGVV